MYLLVPALVHLKNNQRRYIKMEEAKTGYIYVLYNEMFDFYGSGVFEAGKTKDIAQRVSAYTTSYIKPVEIKFLSAMCIDHHLCEKVIFDRLCRQRISSTREFFKLNIDQLIKQIEEVVSGVNNGTILERPPKFLGYNDGSNLHNISNETKAQKLSIIKDFIVSLGFEYDDISQQKRLQKEELINNTNKLKDTSIFTNANEYQ